MISKFAQTKTLWITFIAMMIIGAAFGVVMKKFGFTIIDEMYDPEKIRGHIAAFTPTQTKAHIWTTATLDVAYPLTYGAFFIGMAHRFWGHISWWFILPALLVIPVDLTEGVVQVLALLGNDGVIDAKAILTPAKFILFITAALIALAGLIKMGVMKLRNRTA